MNVLNRGGREFTVAKFPGWDGTKNPVIQPGQSMDLPDAVGEKLVKDYPRELVDTATYSPAKAGSDNAAKDSIIASLKEEILTLENKWSSLVDAAKVEGHKALSALDTEKNNVIAALKKDGEVLGEHVKDLWGAIKSHFVHHAAVAALVPEGVTIPEPPTVPEVPAAVAALVPEVAQDTEAAKPSV